MIHFTLAMPYMSSGDATREEQFPENWELSERPGSLHKIKGITIPLVMYIVAQEATS